MQENKKKFEVANLDNFGDEYNVKVREAFDLDCMVAEVFSERIGHLADSCIVINDNDKLEFEKKDFVSGLDDCGFMFENGEGHVWFGEEGGMVIREVK
tara:strand:- start:636 stop:929 length:294 start_codon:yes stop_codon:yes gene_type:complete